MSSTRGYSSKKGKRKSSRSCSEDQDTGFGSGKEANDVNMEVDACSKADGQSNLASVPDGDLDRIADDVQGTVNLRTSDSEEVPSTSEAECALGRGSLFYRRGRKSSSSHMGRNLVEKSSSRHTVEKLDSTRCDAELCLPEATSHAPGVGSSMVKNSANHLLVDIDNLVGRSETAAEGNYVVGGRIDEDNFGTSSYVAEQAEKVKHSNGEPPAASSCEDEDDGSDVEIQDVKVCDICGDAGREDSLAICSRCSDGAEHTYCMREMLDEVPDGDWLCEECKFTEETETQKNNGKTKFLGRSSSSNSDVSNTDNMDILTDRGELQNVTVYKDSENKKIGDLEVSAKRLAVESNAASSIYSPGRTVISGDTSSKNMDKKKTKQIHVLPSEYPANDSSETIRSPTSNSLRGLKGALMKSKSFSLFTSKPKIKLADDIPQKRKQSLDAKERLGKVMGKSFSFKGNSTCKNISEAKVKMLSPKRSHIQELKGLKNSKERPFERRNSLKSDNSQASQGQANASKHQSRIEDIQCSSSNNIRARKSSQSDGKSSTFARAFGQSTHKNSDTSASLGEVKKQSTLCHMNAESAPVEGPNDSDDQRKHQLSSKDGAAPGSFRPGELADYAVSGTRRGFAVDEGINKDNKLKAAVEVAMKKRMDINKRVAEKVDGLSGLKMDLASASQDSLSMPSQQNCVASPKVHEGVSTFKCIDSWNLAINNKKHLELHTGGSLPSVKVIDSSLDLPSNVELLLRMSAIPDHECIWQGGFEVNRGRKLSDLCNGVQAHASTCASHKVAALVKKFPEKVVLTEVPRSCTWPAQFQEQAVKEDNIALYFFAKDLESYERNYKKLLENMMMNDLALRGIIEGIELLVFPSNQLPKTSQRWNMLFFLWGVFRGRRPNYVSDKAQKLDTSNCDMVHQDNEGVNSIPEDSWLQVPVKDSSFASGCHNRVVSEMGADCSSKKLDCQGSGCHGLSSQANCSTSVSQHGNPNCTTAEDFQILALENESMKDYDETENALGNRRIRLDQKSIPSNCSKLNEASSFHGPSETRRDLMTNSSPALLNPESKMKGGEGRIDALNGNRGDEKYKKLIQEGKCAGILRPKNEDDCKNEGGCSDVGTSSIIGDLQSKDISIQHYINKKRLRENHSKADTFLNSAAVCHEIPHNGVIDASNNADPESMNKRARQVADFYTSNSQQDLTQVNEASPSSAMDIKLDEGNDEKAASTAQGYFFLAERTRTVDDSSSWQVASSEIGDRMPDGSPNLELGLGSLKQQPKQGIVPSFARLLDDEEMDEDKPPDIVKLKGGGESGETLSLSLAFPFADESTVMSMPVTERRSDVSTSLHLFKGLPNK